MSKSAAFVNILGNTPNRKHIRILIGTDKPLPSSLSYRIKCKKILASSDGGIYVISFNSEEPEVPHVTKQDNMDFAQDTYADFTSDPTTIYSSIWAVAPLSSPESPIVDSYKIPTIIPDAPKTPAPTPAAAPDAPGTPDGAGKLIALTAGGIALGGVAMWAVSNRGGGGAK